MFGLVLINVIHVILANACSENSYREFARKDHHINDLVTCRGFNRSGLEETIASFLSQCSFYSMNVNDFMDCHQQCFIDNDCLAFTFLMKCVNFASSRVQESKMFRIMCFSTLMR